MEKWTDERAWDHACRLFRAVCAVRTRQKKEIPGRVVFFLSDGSCVERRALARLPPILRANLTRTLREALEASYVLQIDEGWKVRTKTPEESKAIEAWCTHGGRLEDLRDREEVIQMILDGGGFRDRLLHAPICPDGTVGPEETPFSISGGNLSGLGHPTLPPPRDA